MKHVLLFACALVGLLVPRNAAAQPSDLPLTLVQLPTAASRQLRAALAVELQLSGRQVRFRSTTIDDGAIGEADVVRVTPSADGYEIRYHPGGTPPGLGIRSGSSPRAVALATSALLGELPPPIERPTDAGSIASEPTRTEARADEPRSEAAARLSVPTPSESSDIASGATPRPVIAPAPPQPMPQDERIAWELLAGSLGALINGLPAALLGDQLAGAGPWWALSLVAGVTVGVLSTVPLAGRLTGGNGDIFWSIAAALLGGAIGAAILAAGVAVDTDLTDGVDSGFTVWGVVAGTTLPLALAVVGFEL